MATLQLGNKTLFTQSGSDDPVLYETLDISINVYNSLSGGSVLKFSRYENSNRQTSIPTTTNPYFLWDNIFVRTRTDSSIRVVGRLTGHNKYSYPFYGTFCEISTLSNVTLKRDFIGSHYIPDAHNDAVVIIWFIDSYFNSSILASEESLKIRAGWYSANGGTNAPFEVWNPNSADDARGNQQGSFLNVYEMKE
jgi:hypothetical protein